MGKKRKPCFFWIAACLMLLGSLVVIDRPAQAAECRAKNEDVFMKVETDKTAVYVDEQILLTYKLFTRENTSYEGFEREGRFRGFWLESYGDERPPAVVRTRKINLEGKAFVTAEIKKMVLFPMREGLLKIEPGSIMVKSNGPSEKDTELVLQCEPIEITAKPFPPEGKPESFQGSAGSFKMESFLEKNAKDNRARFIVRLSGKGNVRSLQAPFLKNSPDFRIAKTQEEAKVSFFRKNEIVGRKEFIFELAPQKAGKVTVPAVEFSYFDLEGQKYKTLKTEAAEFEAGEPVPSQPENPGVSNQPEWMILFDMSASMMTEDFKPNRLIALQDGLEKFLQSVQNVQVGIKTFGEKVMSVTSLTSVDAHVIDLLRTQDGPRTVGGNGTATGNAILEAVKELQESPGSSQKAILLLTDGSANMGNLDVLSAGDLAKQAGIPVHILFIGTEGKVPFPVYKNGEKELIESTINTDREALEETAKSTNGQIFLVRDQDQLKDAFEKIKDLMKAE